MQIKLRKEDRILLFLPRAIVYCQATNVISVTLVNRDVRQSLPPWDYHMTKRKNERRFNYIYDYYCWTRVTMKQFSRVRTVRAPPKKMIADRFSVSIHLSTWPSQSFLKNEIERRVRETENADSTPLSVLYVHIDSFLMFYPVAPCV